MALANPLATHVIRKDGPSCSQVGSQENGPLGTVEHKRIQHLCNLPLGRVGPDRAGQEEVKLLSERRCVERCIMIKPRWLRPQHVRLEQMAQSRFKHRPIWLYPAIIAGSQKMNQPVSATQTAATDIEHLGLRMQPHA